MKTSWLAAAGVTLALALWMASGLLGDDDGSGPDAASDANADERAPVRVEIVTAAPAPERRTVTLRGQVEAARLVTVRAETSGTVASVPRSRGARVAARAPLVRLDAGTREAQLAGARAQLASALAERTAADSLGQRGLQSQMMIEQTTAAESVARAEVARLERDLADTVVRAPFAALIESLPVEIGQLVERGDPIASLVDDSAFDVTARASQQVAAELAPGQPVEVTLLTGETLTGTLTWVSRAADAETRSFAIEARLDETDGALASGVSATLVVPVEEVEALFLSPSTFTLDEEGELGVKVLDDEDRVRFLPVSLLRTSLEGAWVTGVPAGARVVTLGQGFVGEGERVTPTEVDGEVNGEVDGEVDGASLGAARGDGDEGGERAAGEHP